MFHARSGVSHAGNVDLASRPVIVATVVWLSVRTRDFGWQPVADLNERYEVVVGWPRLARGLRRFWGLMRLQVYEGKGTLSIFGSDAEREPAPPARGRPRGAKYPAI